jgi:hypothetical protein
MKIKNTQEQADFIKYYKGQLDKLEQTEYPMSLVVYDGNGNKTKQISLNRESMQALIMFFKQLNKGL